MANDVNALFVSCFFVFFSIFPFVCCDSNTKEEHQKSIFVQCEKGGYRLKDNVQFHLYISTSPCGDARIFSPHEAGVEGTTNSSLFLRACFLIQLRIQSQQLFILFN